REFVDGGGVIVDGHISFRLSLAAEIRDATLLLRFRPGAIPARLRIRANSGPLDYILIWEVETVLASAPHAVTLGTLAAGEYLIDFESTAALELDGFAVIPAGAEVVFTEPRFVPTVTAGDGELVLKYDEIPDVEYRIA